MEEELTYEYGVSVCICGEFNLTPSYKRISAALAGVAPLVEALSHAPKGLGFDPQ